MYNKCCLYENVCRVNSTMNIIPSVICFFYLDVFKDVKQISRKIMQKQERKTNSFQRYLGLASAVLNDIFSLV